MSLSLAIFVPSTGGHEEAVHSWLLHEHLPWEVFVDPTIEGEGAGYLQKVQHYYKNTDADVIAYFHSDLFIREFGWDERVLREFEDPNVVLVSFFGAKELGRPNIYVDPYDYRQLARGGCWSNMRDAEMHGQRCIGSMDVAMIDSFSLIVRRSFLDQIGGWPVNHQCRLYEDLWEPCRCCGYHCRVCNQRWYRVGIAPGTEIGQILAPSPSVCEGFPVRPKDFPPSHGSDMWLCMMAARHKKKVRLIGIYCSHSSGGVRGDGRFDYPAWAATTKWGSDAAMHAWWHQYLYSEFKDVLPIKVA